MGVRFVDEAYPHIITILKHGGLLVVPAAPALANIPVDRLYHEALKEADVAILDSGYFCILLRLLNGISVGKQSGLLFLRLFLSDLESRLAEDFSILTIDPSVTESETNRQLLNTKGIQNEQIINYPAPMYDKSNIEDPELLELIDKHKPEYVMVNLGGSTQERLGLHIKRNASYRPTIICTGAAISFITGTQASISKSIDASYLGWLARCIQSPKTYLPRYLSAVNLYKLVLKNPATIYIT